MRSVIAAFEREFHKYKTLAERAIEQLDHAQIHAKQPGGNSVAIVCQHVGGNLKSRFTDFLTTDGEKPWRDRESEFVDGGDFRGIWNEGWRTLFESLATVGDEHLDAIITIRDEKHSVIEALCRAVSHAGYHVGQIVLLSKAMRGAEWQWLSIPPQRELDG